MIENFGSVGQSIWSKLEKNKFLSEHVLDMRSKNRHIPRNNNLGQGIALYPFPSLNFNFLFEQKYFNFL